MHFLEYYYQIVIKYDFINKFFYKSNENIPKLKKIILNFECKNFKIKLFAATLLFLELVTTKSSVITNAKNLNLFIKIQKGQPTGCKIILTKYKMYQLLLKIVIEVIPKFKNFLRLKINKKNSNSFSFRLSNNFIVFYEPKEHFSLINNISNLHITLVANTKTQYELFYLLKSFKLPIIVMRRISG